jgi:beta-glucosidase
MTFCIARSLGKAAVAIGFLALAATGCTPATRAGGGAGTGGSPAGGSGGGVIAAGGGSGTGGVAGSGGSSGSGGGAAGSGGETAAGGATTGTGGATAGTGGTAAGQGGAGGGGSGGTTATGGTTTSTSPTGGSKGGAGGGAGSGGGGAGGAAGGSGGSGAGGSGAGGSGTGGTGTGGTEPTGPFPGEACQSRADGLVAQMTADEKYGQMLQMERLGLTNQDVTQYALGSAFSQGGSAPSDGSATGWADMSDGYHQAALASRLKIPFLYGADEVHGVSTVQGAVVFPHNVGLGATRNATLVEDVARITADEGRGCGVDFFFSPVVAVALDERWGRTYEAFGETTDLASTMGVAMTKGIQFTPTGGVTGILANAKHYLGDGGTANGVTGGDVSGDETKLRAIHLEPYRAAIKARVGSIMPSYSSWQGTKMHINKTMLTDVLKGELGFGGFVLSDFNACFQLGLSNQAGIETCANAGVDMFMSYGQKVSTMVGYLASAVSSGKVPQSRIDDAVRRIVAVKCELGLFEASGKVDRSYTSKVGSAEYRAVARQAVRESLVVLKNDGNVLPIAKTSTVALAGKSADNTGNQCGGWTITWQGSSGNVVPGATSVRAAMEAALGASKVLYSTGGTTTSGASVGVAVIGETPYAEGKGDRTDLALGSDDVNVVKALKNAGLKTVVVLIAGRPMLLDSIMSYADAIVMAWLPGSEGAGVTDILFGDAHPTGKLPHSWPRSMAQIPINSGDATYDPLYPFGHGLTY